MEIYFSIVSGFKIITVIFLCYLELTQSKHELYGGKNNTGGEGHSKKVKIDRNDLALATKKEKIFQNF